MPHSTPTEPETQVRRWADYLDDEPLPHLPEAWGVVIQQEDEDWTPVVSKKGGKRR